MKLAIDLGSAVTATLVLFAAGMVAVPESLSFPVVILAADLAGVAILLIRRRDSVIPIASIFSVLMVVVLLFLGFVITWNRGPVEF